MEILRQRGKADALIILGLDFLKVGFRHEDELPLVILKIFYDFFGAHLLTAMSADPFVANAAVVVLVELVDPHVGVLCGGV